MNAPIRQGRFGRAKWPPGKLWSLWEMFELNASEFVRATWHIGRLRDVLEDKKPDQTLPRPLAKTVKETAADLLPHLEALRAHVTWIEADRLIRNLESGAEIYLDDLRDSLGSIELRLQDELLLRKVFVLDERRNQFFENPIRSFGDDFATRFQSIVYEVDEAGKCYALERSTACVFHLMRVLEKGVAVAARCLGIPDPVKEAERNWGAMLRKINDEIEARNKSTPKRWTSPSDAAFFADVYASLDAVRNVWRNATMHVESKYTPDEAEHIFSAVRGFMKKLSSRMDENGAPLA